MAETYITLFQPTDKVLVSLLKKIDEILGSRSTITFSIAPGEHAIDNNETEKLIKKGNSLIQNAKSGSYDIKIEYRALSIKKNDSYLHYHPYFSTIILKRDASNIAPQQIHEAETALKIHAIIDSFVRTNSLLPSNRAVAGEDEIAAQTAMLSAIQSAASEQLIRADEFFAGLVNKFDNRNSELEAKYQERVSLLEAQYREKEALLDKEEEGLETRRKELDDRDHMHARRAIRGELIKTVQDRQKSFEIDPKTRNLRWPIHGVFLLLLIATGFAAAWSLYVWGIAPNDNWGAVTITSAVKTTVFTVGFITTAGLYVSWMNFWFDKHADAQFQTKQFEIDINRATWAVEAALEWQNIQNEEMPEALLAGITKNLFEGSTSAKESVEYSPLAALTSSLVGSASAVKLNANGNEFSFERKELKKMQAKKQKENP